MLIPIKVSKDFETSLTQMAEKYGEDMEILNGFHESQLNFSDFINGFIDKKVADVTIDANANASNKDIRSLMTEKGKSHDKLFAFSKIFYELKKKYGLKTAREWLETEYNGGFYLHDAPSSSFMPYCYAYDLTRLATEGLFFINNYNNEAPKHLTTFLDDVIEYISFFCNRSSGAVGIPNILIWTYYFWKKDCETGYILKDPNYYARQIFQKLIYRLNQPFLRIDQSAFVNVSIFDRYYLESLFGGVQYPDGSFVIDEIDDIIEHQKVFMEVVSEIRNSTMFTFPVLTYSLLKRDDITEEEAKEMIKSGEYNVFVDQKFARWCSDHNTKWNDANFFMSDNVGTLSNCCFSGDQKVLTKSRSGVQLMTFKELFHSRRTDTMKNFAIFHNGSWVKGKINRYPKRKMYKITTSNKKEIIVTDNHICPTDRGNVMAMDLSTDDYLLFNTRKLDAINEHDQKLTYEHGVVIGAYLKCGFKDDKQHAIKIASAVPFDNYAVIRDSIGYVHKTLHPLCREYEMQRSQNDPNDPEVIILLVHTNFVDDWVKVVDDRKELNLDCLLQSYEFRKGILDGYETLEANTENRLYACSMTLIEQLECLMTSLGLNTIIDIRDKKSWQIPSIRYYTPNNKRHSSNAKYIVINNSEYFRITDIKTYDYKDDFTYCFQMDNQREPYFTLPNGIITHNCRLLSDTKKLDAFINSIGGTALSIGSVKVNTINLMRIALETRGVGESNHPFRKNPNPHAREDAFLKILRERAELCCKTLDVIRHIIKRNVEKGLLPNYCDGGVELDKQYCTIGVIATAEIMEEFGYLVRDDYDYIAEDGFAGVRYTDDGIRFASKIFEVLNDVKDNFTDEYSFNIESVPAERAAVILCQKDNIMYDLHDRFIYANQWISLSDKCSLKEKLRVSSILDAKCSGGAIAHINLENNFPTTDMAWDMLNKIALQNVIYFAFNTRINECPNHHGFVGTDHCPHCGEGVYDTFQRIVGFLVPSRAYSKDRFKEFNARKWYGYADMLRD